MQTDSDIVDHQLRSTLNLYARDDVTGTSQVPAAAAAAAARGEGGGAGDADSGCAVASCHSSSSNSTADDRHHQQLNRSMSSSKVSDFIGKLNYTRTYNGFLAN